MKDMTLSGGSMPKRNGIGNFVDVNRKPIVQVISGLLILLFLYTGANKFFSFEHFTNQMRNQVFPRSWIPVIIWTLPTLEIAISIGLMFDKTKKISFGASIVLMSLFTIYTALVLFGAFNRVPCSCGGVIEHLTWTQHLFFNLFYLVISILGYSVLKKSPTKPEIQSFQKPVFT